MHASGVNSCFPKANLQIMSAFSEHLEQLSSLKFQNSLMCIGTSLHSEGHPVSIVVFSVCIIGSCSVALCSRESLSMPILIVFIGFISSSSRLKT